MVEVIVLLDLLELVNQSILNNTTREVTIMIDSRMVYNNMQDKWEKLS